MKNTFLKYIALIAVIILLDLLTKGILLYLILGFVPSHGSAWILVPVPYLMTQVTDFFNIVFTWNPGTSFSLLRNIGESAPWLISTVTGFIIGILGYYLFCKSQNYERFPLALIVGGALGNLLDRVRYGAVIDFLDFHIGGLHWPAFNFADICIVAGVGLYMLNWLLARRRCLAQVKTKGKN